MNDTYVEVLVKRKSKSDKNKLTKLALLLIILSFCIAMISTSTLVYIFTVLIAFTYYTLVQRLDIEFEYYYMNGELDISKIYSKSRRKTIISASDSMIKIIVPQGEEVTLGYESLKTIDCSANDPMRTPLVMICEQKKDLKKILLQPNDHLLKELKRNMPDKVKID